MATALLDVARQLVERAKKAGAREAEAYVERSRSASVTVRQGEIEELSEAASKGVGLRVVEGGRLGFASTTDFSDDGLSALVSRAVALARAAAADKANGLPEAKLTQGPYASIADLFDPAVEALEPAWKLRTALALEEAAKAEDARCSNFEGSGAGDEVSEVAIANTHGLAQSERGTSVYLWCSPVAQDGDSLQTSTWSDHRRFLSALDPAEAVGREAARRTVRMLGARSVPSQKVPVVFDPRMAAGFFGSLASAANGDLVFRKSSFLTGRLGERIASPLVTLVDDPLQAGALGATSFDGEGVATKRLPIVEGGVLSAFLYDVRTARKAKAKSTGHARRGYSGLPSVGPWNLRVEPGTTSLEALLAPIKQGLFVTSMLGRGANVVTGDYSRGANGLWIEDGTLTFPVQEVTVAGALVDMLQAIDGVGSDLLARGAVASPSIRFAELAVGGR